MLVEAVWSSLAEGKWMTERAMKDASGLSDEHLSRVISFLSSWNFVEIRKTPTLQVKRKAGVLSPLLVLGLLQSPAGKNFSKTHALEPRRLAERIACRNCGSTSFTRIGGNEVECSRCSERQWFAIDKTRPLEFNG